MKKKYRTSLVCASALMLTLIVEPFGITTRISGGTVRAADVEIFKRMKERLSTEGGFLSEKGNSMDGMNFLEKENFLEELNSEEEADSDSDWGEVPERIAAVMGRTGSRNVDIVTGYIMEIPEDMLRNLAGKNVTLAMQTGERLALSLTGTDIRTAGKAFRIVLSSEDVIPEAVKESIMADALYSREFSMMEKNAYPFRVNVHLNLGADNADKPAVLYYYDEGADVLRLTGIYKIKESGSAMFALNRGDEYIVVVRDKAAYTVEDGDYLGRIARKNGVSIKALLQENPQIVNPDEIYPGQILVIP